MVRGTNNEVFVELGTEQNLNDKDVVFSEMQIAMTHKATKTFLTVLKSVVDKIEEMDGPITLPEGKEEKIRRAVQVEKPK